MEEYNQLIASHLLDGIERGIIKSTPQPTMFGGKRMRKWVLPGSSESDYPGTLSVGSLDGSSPDTIGGSFWKDFGHGFKTGFTGTAKALAPIAVPIAKELLLAKMRGAGYDSSSDDECGMDGGMIVGADGHGIYHGAHQMAEAGVSRADGGAQGGYFTIGSRQFGKKHGGARDKDPVREYMKQIGSVINPALLVGLGMPGADGHGVRKMGGASPAEKAIGMANPLLWGYDLGKDVIAPAMMKVIPPRRGRGRMVKGSPEAKEHMAQLRAKKMEGGAYVSTGKSKPAGYIRRLVAEKTSAPPFDIDEVAEPSENLKMYATTAKRGKKAKAVKGKAGRPKKFATAEEAYASKLESNRVKRAEKRAMAKAQKEGGALLMNHPGEFHSSIYPHALESYKHQMSVGGKKSSFLGDMGKAFAPIAKDVIVPVGKELATEYIRGKMRGGVLPKSNTKMFKSMIDHIKSGQPMSALGLSGADLVKLLDTAINVKRDDHPALVDALEHVTGALGLSSLGGKKSSFLGDMGKAFAPIAKDVIVPVGKELATEFIRNKMRGGKSSFLSGLSKAVAPVAKDVFVPLAKEMATEAIRSKMRGGKGNAFIKGFAKVVSPVAKTVGEEIVVPLAKEAIRNKMRGGARSARNEIVKKIMAERGLSLPMASKFVKEHGLY